MMYIDDGLGDGYVWDRNVDTCHIEVYNEKFVYNLDFPLEQIEEGLHRAYCFVDQALLNFFEMVHGEFLLMILLKTGEDMTIKEKFEHPDDMLDRFREIINDWSVE